MNKNALIIGGAVVVLGVGGYFIWDSMQGEEKITLANGITATQSELIEMGYIPVQIGNQTEWVLRSEYEKALQQSNGQQDKLVVALDTAQALIPIVKNVVQTFRNR